MSDILIKFFGYRDFDLDALCNSYLWFSKLEEFNDPFEGLYSEQIKKHNPKTDNIDKNKLLLTLKKSLISQGYSDLDATNYVAEFGIKHDSQETYSKIISETEKDLEKEYDRFRKSLFASFTDNRETLTSKLMWSHYGSGLTGFCIEFDQKELIKSIKSNTPINIIYYSKINYQEATIIPLHEKLSLFYSNSSKCGAGEALNRKCPEWKYENEFRLSIAPSNNREAYYSHSAINSITIGEKMPKSKRNTLFMALKGIFGINWEQKVKIAKVDKTTFKLKISPYQQPQSIPSK